MEAVCRICIETSAARRPAYRGGRAAYPRRRRGFSDRHARLVRRSGTRNRLPDARGSPVPRGGAGPEGGGHGLCRPGRHRRDLRARAGGGAAHRGQLCQGPGLGPGQAPRPYTTSKAMSAPTTWPARTSRALLLSGGLRRHSHIVQVERYGHSPCWARPRTCGG